MVADMQDVIGVLQSLYEDALADAGESFRRAEKNTTGDGSVDREYDIKLSPRMEEAFKPYAKEINSVVNQSISGKGNIDGKAQVKDIMPTGPKITAMVAVSSGNAIDISQRIIALSTSDIWHEFKRHTSVGAETSRGQIAFTKRQFQNAVKCIISPDMVETIFADANNPTQKQSFAYVKKTSRGNYVVVEAVGGKKNPHIYPVMILQFSKDKWNKMMSQGKTLGEILFENDAKKLQALDIQKNKKSRVTAAQFASYEAIANTLRSPQLDTKVSQPEEKVKEKFSVRDPEAEKVNKVLQKENTKLKEDVEHLKELLKLQRSVTNGTKFTKTSVEAMASMLMKGNNVKGDKKELAKLLNEVYEYNVFLSHRDIQIDGEFFLAGRCILACKIHLPLLLLSSDREKTCRKRGLL